MHAPPLLRFTCTSSVLLLLISCGTDTPSSPAVEVDREGNGSQLTDGPASQPLERLGLGLAVALRDPAIRVWVRKELEASPYVEWRVALKDLLHSKSGDQPIAAILARSAVAGFRISDVAQLPSLELYLPIAEDRVSWQGGSNIQVAVRRHWSRDFVIHELNGAQRIEGEDYRPSTPTLVLGRSEIDYTDKPSSVRGGNRSGSGTELGREGAVSLPGGPAFAECQDCTAPPPPPPPPPGTNANPFQHTRIYSWLLFQHQEGPLMGLNEIEFFGSVDRAYLECSRHNGIQAGYYYYVTNLSDFNNTIATAIPKVGYLNFRFDGYEDDDDACYRRSADGYLGSKTFGLPGYNGYQTTDYPNKLRFQVRNVTP